MPEEARAYLADQFAEDTARLEKEFDFDTSAWPCLRQASREDGLVACAL